MAPSNTGRMVGDLEIIIRQPATNRPYSRRRVDAPNITSGLRYTSLL
jgi:hypothetical protein